MAKIHVGWKIAGVVVAGALGLRLLGAIAGPERASSILIFGGIVLVILLPGILRRRAARQRRAVLAERFGPQIADAIMRRQVWQGQTEEMLLESRGAPVDMDETVLKTKIKRVYKYDRVASNRFALKVMVENGVVVGWDDKR